MCVLVTLGAKWDFDTLPKLYPWFHVIIWTITFTNATVMAVLGKYGDAVLWCWLPASESTLRIAAFFDIIWFALLFNLTVYIFIGWELWKAQRGLKKALNSGEKTPGNAPITNPQDDPVLRYARRVSYFILGYVVIWVPASTNRSMYDYLVWNFVPLSKKFISF